VLNRTIVKAGLTAVSFGMAFGIFNATPATAGSYGSPSGASFFTAVGGASGLTLQLNPHSVVCEGAASRIMSKALFNKTGGSVYKVYSAARMQSPYAGYSEIRKGNSGDGQFVGTQPQLTGDKSSAEILYSCDNNGVVWYGIVVRADSAIGMRFACNRQYIYGFLPLATGDATFITADANGNPAPAPSDIYWPFVLADINNKCTGNYQTASSGLPIEGGLSEAYKDSGLRMIDKYNRMFPGANWGGPNEPSLYSANLQNSATPDNLLAIAVCAVLYNTNVFNSGGTPGTILNITTEQARAIEAGMVDNWGFFFGRDGMKMPLNNFYREPLSGTANCWNLLTMRGVELQPNGVGGGIPDLTISQTVGGSIANNPGSGTMLKAVQSYNGGFGYSFLQRFTVADYSTVGLSGYTNIRVAKVNGWEPYSFASGNSLPGVNSVPDVDQAVPYFPNVIDGKYPLWCYEHCFDATNGASANLTAWINLFTDVNNAADVQFVGLIPMGDMQGQSSRLPSLASGPNVNRGGTPAIAGGIARGGFVSPMTGETVRDGMMVLPDDHTVASPYMPGESYVEMRP